MRKIETLFVRDPKTHLAIPEVNFECQWVMDGEGVATEKFDGTACLIRNGKFYKRLHLKEGLPRPEGWLHWSFDLWQDHGHGWIEVENKPRDKYHCEGYRSLLPDDPDGTYELVGPKIQGNPYNLTEHQLWQHGAIRLDGPMIHSFPPLRTFECIQEYLHLYVVEGIVWHHPDGRMVKIKRRDFGLVWPERRLNV